MKQLLLISLFTMLKISVSAQTELPLYTKKISGAKPAADQEKSVTSNDGMVRISKISVPTIKIYQPEVSINNHIAIIIFPGGGYAINAIKHEGWDVAEYFAKQGFTAFVVKYRLPDSATMEHPDKGPLQDAQEAIRFVRRKAKALNIDPHKVGVMGFSAGGHLASTASTHFIYHKKPETVRPDFSVLIYPVISMDKKVSHTGSHDNLIGKNATEEMENLYSNELQVKANTPPAFLVHAIDDRVVIENSYRYRDALIKNNVPVETLFYEKGGHGYGMYNKTSDIFWPAKVAEWIKKLN